MLDLRVHVKTAPVTRVNEISGYGDPDLLGHRISAGHDPPPGTRRSPDYIPSGAGNSKRGGQPSRLGAHTGWSQASRRTRIKHPRNQPLSTQNGCKQRHHTARFSCRDALIPFTMRPAAGAGLHKLSVRQRRGRNCNRVRPCLYACPVFRGGIHGDFHAVVRTAGGSTWARRSISTVKTSQDSAGYW